MRDLLITPVVIALEHVQLAMPAGQESAAKEFYANVLGFTRIPRPPQLGGYEHFYATILLAIGWNLWKGCSSRCYALTTTSR
jgi:hypothetical protein